MLMKIVQRYEENWEKFSLLGLVQLPATKKEWASTTKNWVGKEWGQTIKSVKKILDRAAMSNPNGLLSQKLCHCSNQGHTLNDIRGPHTE